MKIFTRNGKKSAIVNLFIDPENGFTQASLSEKQGGALYVPEGEQVAPLMGAVIARSRDTVFVLGQDYHPANHISFMVNHPGVMEYRIGKFFAFLAANDQPPAVDAEDARLRALQPVHFFDGPESEPALFPFNEIVLDEERNIIGLKEDDGRIRKVEVETSSGLAPSPEDRGRVTKVLDAWLEKTFDEYRAEGRLLGTQTLWPKHCVQGTESSLFPRDMNLPEGLRQKLEGDLMSRFVYFRDAASGNEFYVVRKGAHSEVDSYGIGVENDGETMTKAWEVFQEIAQGLKKLGCEEVILNIGGLATNFCVEFSANNVADFLAGHFKMRGMEAVINFVPEISRGIPIPGDADVPFSLAGASARMQRSRGIGETTVKDILAMSAPHLPEKKQARAKFGK